MLKPWGVRRAPTSSFVGPVMMKLTQIPGIEMFPIMPPALPGGGFMPVEFYICSTTEPERILELAEQLKMRAMQAGVFRFPPPIDTKIDQPESQILIDHDKVFSRMWPWPRRPIA